MYHKQRQLFNLQQMPLGYGAIERVLRNTTGVFLGNLAVSISQLLLQIPTVAAKPNTFTLVNASYLPARASFGFMDTPPKKVLPLGCSWIFVFALDKPVYGDYITDHLYRLGLRMWKTSTGNFLVYGVTPPDAYRLGLDFNTKLPAAYNVVGTVTKWAVRNNIHTISVAQPKPEYTRRTLGETLMQSPDTWVYSKEVWKHSPGIISDVFITPVSTLNYLQNHNADARFENVVDDCSLALHYKMIGICNLALQLYKYSAVFKDIVSCLYDGIIPETIEYGRDAASTLFYGR